MSKKMRSVESAEDGQGLVDLLHIADLGSLVETLGK